MFLVVGKGAFLKDALISKLQEWGIPNPVEIVNKVEYVGSYEHGPFRILRVKY